MKKLLQILYIFTFCVVYGQKNDLANKINLSIVLPEEDEMLSYNALSKLNSKTIQLLTYNEIVSGVNNSFVIYPSLVLGDSKIVETGLYAVHSVTMEFNYYIKNIESNTIFSSYTKQIEGTGKTEREAIANSISKLDVKDVKLTTFIHTGKDKIINYYKNSCNQIIAKADNMALQGNYEEALSLLISVPSEVDCFSKAKQKALTIYKQYSTKKCQELILEAKSYLAQNDKESAANILATINPESTCKTEASQLLNQIEAKLNAQEKKEWDFMVKQDNDRVALEKSSIKAIRDICVAYYKKNPVTYNYIIR